MRAMAHLAPDVLCRSVTASRNCSMIRVFIAIFVPNDVRECVHDGMYELPASVLGSVCEKK